MYISLHRRYGKGATPVLDRLRPFVCRDGRCAVMLACGCELFAVRDVMRMCPFEACAGVYTTSAARVLAFVAHEWHVHGPPVGRRRLTLDARQVETPFAAVSCYPDTAQVTNQHARSTPPGGFFLFFLFLVLTIFGLRIKETPTILLLELSHPRYSIDIVGLYTQVESIQEPLLRV